VSELVKEDRRIYAVMSTYVRIAAKLLSFNSRA